MASGLVEGSTSIEIGAGTPSMAAGTCVRYSISDIVVIIVVIIIIEIVMLIVAMTIT